jgi:YegS/Rv2252/BmrU family lipid kinase
MVIAHCATERTGTEISINHREPCPEAEIGQKLKTVMTYVIVNPAAGSGKARYITENFSRKIREVVQGEVNFQFTAAQHHATYLAREALKKGAEKIIAVGGDGTINEVVNGFFENGIQINPDCELGIISCGTGKGFANSLKLPQSIEDQIALVGRTGFRTIDTGHVHYINKEGEPESRYYVNESQTGIGSKVASLVGSKHKVFGGPLAFGFSATIQAIILKPIELKIRFDEEPEEDLKLIGFVAGNGTECAGGMKLTPGAKLDDGLFDVLLMYNMGVITRLVNLTKVYSGKHLLSPYFAIKKCKRIKISSETKLLLEADGEMLGFPPYEFTVVPAAIRVKAGF